MSKSPTAVSSAETTSNSTSASWLAPPLHLSEGARAHALVIAWSLTEPERIGEVALLGPDEGRSAQVLGRGPARPEDDTPRVRFVRQRASHIEDRPPLAAPGVSRRQLKLTPSLGGLLFERIGKCAVFHNGRSTDSGVLEPGDVLTLHKQLVLLYQRRSTTLPPLPSAATLHFGVADPDGVVGESEAAWRLRENLALAARSGTHVLVLGASGTGKELAARAIHRLSPRAGRPFVAKSAAAIPPTLIDAELFGNRRDYPNVGMPEREGVVGAAHGGTLFLDEIGELTPELQTHLLRLLDQGGEYHRLGEATPRRSDLRVVAATNRAESDLKHDVAARFALRITLPGLEERQEDIPLLVRHLLDESAAASPDLRARFFEQRPDGAPFARLDPAFVEALLTWPWSTHVRELRALLWASIQASRGQYLAIPPEMNRTSPETEEAPADGQPTARAIRDALAQHPGDQAKVCAALGVPNRFALYRLMRKRGLDPGDRGRGR